MEVVGGHDDGDAVAVQRADEGMDEFVGFPVEAREGFVKDDDACVKGQEARQCDAAFLAAGTARRAGGG